MTTERKSFGQKMGIYIIEILIIIIGISISFALNEWNTHRKENEAYKNHLENLREDLTIDLNQMRSDSNALEEVKRSLLFTVNLKKADEKSLENLTLALSSLIRTIKFLPNHNTYRMLNSIGGYEVFRDELLARDVIQLYQYDYAHLEFVTDIRMNIQHDHLMPYLYQKVYFDDQAKFPYDLGDLQKFERDHAFSNICIDYEQPLSNNIYSYYTSIQKLKEILKKIEIELK